jgi:hypothetical protein
LSISELLFQSPDELEMLDPLELLDSLELLTLSLWLVLDVPSPESVLEELDFPAPTPASLPESDAALG